VPENAIALLPNATSIYSVPLTLEDTGITDVITKKLKLKSSKPKLDDWRKVVKLATAEHDRKLKIGFVAKYMDNSDTYMSVLEALKAAAWHKNVGLDISWLDAADFDSDPSKAQKELQKYDGILVPGGFGKRGLEGKIAAAQYALDSKKPYLGLCLGMQVAVIAAARNAGLKQATTFELDPNSKEMVINTMADQSDKLNTGGTMRLGNYPCVLDKQSIAAKLYGTTKIIERHRHRGECNNKYISDFQSWGIKASGINPDNNLVEIIEAIDHPYFVACQFHPEFKSRPNRPHPLFMGFIDSII
jgi:CTP synthase